MKKVVFLWVSIVFVGFTGCVPHAVIVREASPHPQPVYASTVIVAPTEADTAPIPRRDPHQKQDHATTPLIYAVSINNLDGIQYLLSRGENPNEIFYSAAYEATPLQEAVKRGNLTAAQYIIARGANLDLKANDKTALEMAVLKNDLKMANLLVSNRAYIYASNILEDSVREHDTAVLKYLLDNGAAKRSVPSARRGADYALIKACRLGNIEAMRLLINAGADVSVVDSKGRGLLFYAAERNDIAVLEFIFPYNIRMLNVIDDEGFTPLMVAVERNNIHGARFLVAKGAYIDVPNKKSFTVIHYSKNAEMTRFLNEEAPRHKKPSGYAMRREATSKYDDHQVKPDIKAAVKSEPIHQRTIAVQQPEQKKIEAKPNRPHDVFEVDSSLRHGNKIEKKPEPSRPEIKPADKQARPVEQVRPVAARPTSNVQLSVSQNVQQNAQSRPTAAIEAAPKSVEQTRSVEQARPAKQENKTERAKPEAKTETKSIEEDKLALESESNGKTKKGRDEKRDVKQSKQQRNR
ncbi:MAG: ankyrin repeat domain-containing protein [Endomicrobium sp.]|jgi:ankyrin repeat protein|nr:ankyrin repeat domain-containing protein [Endomicrobium sp.]